METKIGKTQGEVKMSYEEKFYNYKRIKYCGKGEK
jgi:hypothetical protein